MIIALVKTLEQKGYAYVLEDGVYYDTARYPGYGKLGHVDLAGLQAGARVEENKQKKNMNRGFLKHVNGCYTIHIACLEGTISRLLHK